MLGTITRPRRVAQRLLAYAALLAVAASCQAVAGIDSRKLDPPPPDGVCNFPTYITNTGPLVRVANLVPTSDVVDICIRDAGASSWGRPLLFEGGTGCPKALGGENGFAYGEVSDKFNAPSAMVDVKLIAGGGACSDPGLTEGDGLSLATDATTTLARIGGAKGVSQQIVALPEENSKDRPDTIRLRFVHAMPGVGPLDFGDTTTAHLPASITTPLLDQIPFGQAPTTQKALALGNVDARGYFDILTAPLNIVAQQHGQTKGLLLQPISSSAVTYSLFAIGVAGDNLHPLDGLLCNEDVGPQNLKEQCTRSPLPTISVDVWNPALYGPNSPANVQRDPGTLAGFAATRDSDVMCLVEVDSDADQSAFKGLLTAYPYVYTGPAMGLSTPFSDPRDQNGNTPPAPTTPACGGSVPQADVDAAFQCMEQHCSNKPGDPSGWLNTTTDCLASNCAGPLAQLQADSKACFDCTLDYVASGNPETYGNAEQLCLSNPAAPLGFEGHSNSMIFSRYPLKNTDAWVLPSTNYRRTVLYAQVQLEDQSFDFYCGFLMTDGIASDLPYVGNYGGMCDPTTASCYDNEQTYEAKQLVDWVHKKSVADMEYSGGRPAIVVGDWRSGDEVDVPGSMPAQQILAPLNPATVDLMKNQSSGFTAVNPMSWTPQCNYCPTMANPNNPTALTNPYNSPTTNYFVSQPFLYHWPGAQNAAVDMSLIYTTQMIANTGPASPYFGVNLHVLRPNASGM